MIIDKLFEIGRLLSEKMEEKGMTLSAAKEQVKRIIRDDIRPKMGKYFFSILMLLLAVWILPLIFLVPGIYYESKNLIVLGGVLRALLTVALLLFAAPLGILLEIVLGGFKNSGERYVKLISAIFVTELFFTLIACFIPFKNRLDLIPPFILASAILGFLNSWFFQPKVTARITGIIFIGIIIAFFIPAMPFTSGKLTDFVTNVGRNVYGPRLVSKSCDELKQEGIRWAADGSNKYWYHKDKTSGEIRIYDGEGRDIIDGDVVKPFENNILALYCEQKKRKNEKTKGKSEVASNMGEKLSISIIIEQPPWPQTIPGDLHPGKYKFDFQPSLVGKNAFLKIERPNGTFEDRKIVNGLASVNNGERATGVKTLSVATVHITEL